MTDEDDLGWFHRLSMDDKVHLLRDPYAALPPRLIEQLVAKPGITGARWASQMSPTRWTLVPSEAAKVADQRHQLELWWHQLEPDNRAYLVQHRTEELPADYAQAPLVREFLELKARDGER
jgi:hypothetical protein